MKKFIKFLFIFLMSFTILVGCNDSDGGKDGNDSSEIETFRIKFMVDDEVFETIKIEFGSKIELPVEPVKEGYTFIGWYTEDGDKIDESWLVEGKLTVYAKFSEEIDIVLPEKPDCLHSNCEYHDAYSIGSCGSYFNYSECKDCGTYLIDVAKSYIACGYANTDTWNEVVGGVIAECYKMECLDCGLKVVGKSFENIDNCDVTIINQYTIYSHDEVVFENLYFYETYKNHTFTDTPKYTSLGNCETDGYSVLNECQVCGYTEKEIRYGHTFEYFSYYSENKCGGMIFGDKCLACGKYDYINASLLGCVFVETSSKHSDNGSFHYTSTLYMCLDCGGNILVNKDEYKTDGCVQLTKYQVSLNSEIFAMDRYVYSHELNYEVIDYTGSCYDPYSVIITCKNCDYKKEEYSNSGHYMITEEASYPELCSKLKYEKYHCVACNEFNSLSVDEIDVWESTSNNNKYICKYGCCEKIVNTTITENKDECTIYVDKVISYYKNGKFVGEMTDNYTRVVHDLIYDVTEFNGNCFDGYNLNAYCKNCDHSEGGYYNYHINFNDLSYVGTCAEVMISDTSCKICNQQFDCYIEECNDVWNLTISNDDYKEYICDNGCCKKRIQMIEVNENCRYSYYEETTYYIGDELVGKALVLYNSHESHQYEETFVHTGIDCNFTYYRHNECVNCGDFYEWECTGHTTSESQSCVVSYDNFCGEAYNLYYCNGCNNLVSFDYQYINCSWVQYDADDTTTYYECENCGAFKYETVESYESAEKCYYITTRNIKVVFQGITLFDYDVYQSSFKHEFKYETENYTNCYGDYALYKTCILCGYEENYQFHNGHIYKDYSYLVDVEGYCGSEVYVNGCCVICDEKTSVFLINTNCSFEQWYQQDGITYSVCTTCGAELIEKRELLSKDYSCYGKFKNTIKIVLNGEVIMEEVYYNFDYSHNLTYEYNKYGVSCESGMFVTEYCSDCKVTTYYERDYHVYHYETIYVFDEDCCGIIRSFAVCDFCDYSNCINTINFGCNMNFEWIKTEEVNLDISHTISYEQCKECGLIYEYETYYTELENGLKEYTYIYRYYLKDSDEVATEFTCKQYY